MSWYFTITIGFFDGCSMTVQNYAISNFLKIWTNNYFPLNPRIMCWNSSGGSQPLPAMMVRLIKGYWFWNCFLLLWWGNTHYILKLDRPEQFSFLLLFHLMLCPNNLSKNSSWLYITTVSKKEKIVVLFSNWNNTYLPNRCFSTKLLYLKKSETCVYCLHLILRIKSSLQLLLL